MRKNNSTIYVGNLPDGFKERNLEDLFKKYGRIVDIKFKRGRGYAYIEFGCRRDALEAIEGSNGHQIDGCKLVVEFGHGLWGPGPAVPRHTPHKVIIKNLPPSATWQELKDHMKMAGTVCFADVFHDGHNTTGEVEYIDEEVMYYAIRKLTNSEFKNRLSTNIISVEKYDGLDLAKDKGCADKPTVPRNSHRGTGSERKDAHSPSRSPHRSTRSEHKHARSPSRLPTLPTKRRRI